MTGIAPVTLDERLRTSPIREGFIARTHFLDACASLWLEGELVHLEDLVLHDAEKDVRSPTHALTRAHAVLRARRRIASADPGWALSASGLGGLRGRAGEDEDADPAKPLAMKGGARLFRQHLVEIGVCRSAPAALQPAEPCIVADFKVWLRKHRGASDSTIKLYARDAAHLMLALGDDPVRPNITASRCPGKWYNSTPGGRFAFDVEACHFLLTHFDPFWVSPRVELAPYRQAGLGRGGGDEFDHRQATGQGRSPPVLGDVAEQPVLNLVPLRRPRRVMQTCRVSPVLSASFCSSILNSRTRDPLEPPPSAVIMIWSVSGYLSQPIRSSQRRIQLTENCAVSLSMPTLTQPALRRCHTRHKVRPCRVRRRRSHAPLPGRHSLSAGNRCRRSCRADWLFLLRVDRDHRLAGRLHRQRRGIDMLELRITVGIADAFQRLAFTCRQYCSDPNSLGMVLLLT